MTGSRNLLALCALVIASAGAHTSAWSGVNSASARVESLSIKLIDLDLNDGISPSLSVPVDGVLPPGWNAYIATLPGPPTAEFTRYSRVAFDAVHGISSHETSYFNTGSFIVPSVSSEVSPALRGSASDSGLEIHVENGSSNYQEAFAEIRGANEAAFLYYPNTPFRGVFAFPALILSPNTTLEIAAHMTAEISMDPACSGIDCGNAIAQAWVMLGGNNLLQGSPTVGVTDGVGLDFLQLASGQHSGSVSRDITASFTSAAESEWVSLWVRSYAAVLGSQVASPVPELPTQILLALGLATVATLSRRTQRCR